MIEEVFRDEWPRVVATLARRFGDLNVAEEAAGEAVVAAVAAWRERIPPNPGGWLKPTGLSLAGNDHLFANRSEVAGAPKSALPATAWVAGSASRSPPPRPVQGCGVVPRRPPGVRRPDSLRLVVGRITGRVVVVAGAQHDGSCPPAQAELLERVLTEGASTTPSRPIRPSRAPPGPTTRPYDEAAADRHWRAFKELYGAMPTT